MQLFSVQIWLFSGLVISYAHPGKHHEEATVTSKGSPEKWPVPQNAAQIGAFLSQAVKNTTKPSPSAEQGAVLPPSSDMQVLHAPAYKPGLPSVIQNLFSSVPGSNHSASNFFAIPSSTTAEPTPQTNNTAMNDPLPNPVPGIVTTVSNATNSAQEITSSWGTNVQNGIFGSASWLGNRPSNDQPASGSTDSPGSSNPIQGIINASQASWNNATGAAQNLAGQFGPNVQNGLSNIFGFNINRPSNDEPVMQSSETNSTAVNETTSSTESNGPTTIAATTSTTSPPTTSVTTSTSGSFLPLVSFVNNSQSLVNSSILLQTVTSQLTGSLPNGLGNFVLRPSKPNKPTKVSDVQEFSKLDDDNRATATLKAVPPPSPPTCSTCFSSCFYRPFQRIVGATDVSSDSKYPFIVLITYLDSPSGHGALINDRAIITTATIIASMPLQTEIRALLGVYDRSQNTSMSSEEIGTIYTHPDFKSRNQFANNIGLLILKNPLTSFTPICLPTAVSKSPPVSKATVIGWGANHAGGGLVDVLQEYELQMFSPVVCYMATTSLTSRATANNLCGGSTKFISKDGAACTGDSGDPLVVMNGTSWELIGISLEIPEFECGKNRFPAMFTAIIPYLDWITTYGVGCECYDG
ncbi:polycystic kidney disease protein 1-like 3 [Anopheles moucheti]|uniref:polycystic kidney disease protein 1-like 3 n=1 Tax=Anopheles moucheti TaxID=186751 RepID=UPI0022F0B50B|nr:polycystic kidney disease protein 1-like 3 [Anopheles moucheti]